MAGLNTLSQRNDQRLPLYTFLIQRHEILVGNPVRTLHSIVECLKQIHDLGRAHGAVCAQRMLVSSEGMLDAEFFAARDGQREPLKPQEAYSYYPDGTGATLEEQQHSDVQALASVLHLIVLGHEPAPVLRNANIRQWGQPIEAPWPPLFLQYAELLFTHGPRAVEAPLEALMQSLETVVHSNNGESMATDAASSPESQEPPGESSSEVPVSEVPAETQVESTATESVDQPQPAEDGSAAAPESTPPPTVAAAMTPPPMPIRLPNATVGRAYSASLLTALEIHKLSFDVVTVADDPPKGLSCESSVLSGVPAESGEFSFSMTCASAEPESGKPSALNKTFLLTINPDPSSLWKNTPSNTSAPFWKPDVDAAALPDAPLLVTAASRRGRSHAHVGSCRDDDFSMAWLPETGWYALTVADGAGSAKYSREGSRIACVHVLQYFSKLLGEVSTDPLTPLVEAYAADPSATSEARSKLRTEVYNHFGRVAWDARRLIEEKANTANAVSRDFHTTIIIVLARPLASGGWFVASFSIGDGAAALVRTADDDIECLLTKPDGGEFAGQTVFLTVKEALASGEAIMNRIKFAIVPSFEALLLVTDGVSDPRFASEAALGDADAWRKLWAEVQPLVAGASTRAESAERLLDWLNFPSPGHHDDRTIIVLTETQPSASL
ncbi:protein phosphatase 2C-like protein [Roseimicrobium gellanilyticum]|uniref:Protein phosphatase 2C-like protein n=1 Tax=Roseimicrobium gellanilyticum TaxID=748857 RepID=A0A366HQ05_9BACT|nr:PP2C family serine/threonine-protein phosphatase [Roseimicrobium gellanilyticum]RBP44611.1 protein phosphatase 2C-like protein [Roseimicrobium gellanilyticum]